MEQKVEVWRRSGGDEDAEGWLRGAKIAAVPTSDKFGKMLSKYSSLFDQAKPVPMAAIISDFSGSPLGGTASAFRFDVF